MVENDIKLSPANVVIVKNDILTFRSRNFPDSARIFYIICETL